jgi:hypothetical protein
MKRYPQHLFKAVTLVLAAAALVAGPGASQSSPAAATPSPATLAAVAARVNAWLAANHLAGFRVVEVMAFSNNDYAAVNDKIGRPAFELLVAPDRSWLMEEPASMMWNTKYGMLGHLSNTLQPIPGLSMMWGGGMMRSHGMMGSPSSWYSAGTGAVTSLEQAVAVANSWLAHAHPGEIAETDGRAFPGYFTLDTKRNDKTSGMLSVNRVSGAIWYHGWHGTFLAERMFTT